MCILEGRFGIWRERKGDRSGTRTRTGIGTWTAINEKSGSGGARARNNRFYKEKY